MTCASFHDVASYCQTFYSAENSMLWKRCVSCERIRLDFYRNTWNENMWKKLTSSSFVLFSFSFDSTSFDRYAHIIYTYIVFHLMFYNITYLYIDCAKHSAHYTHSYTSSHMHVYAFLDANEMSCVCVFIHSFTILFSQCIARHSMDDNRLGLSLTLLENAYTNIFNQSNIRLSRVIHAFCDFIPRNTLLLCARINTHNSFCFC